MIFENKNDERLNGIYIFHKDIHDDNNNIEKKSSEFLVLTRIRNNDTINMIKVFNNEIQYVVNISSCDVFYSLYKTICDIFYNDAKNNEEHVNYMVGFLKLEVSKRINSKDK